MSFPRHMVVTSASDAVQMDVHGHLVVGNWHTDRPPRHVVCSPSLPRAESDAAAVAGGGTAGQAVYQLDHSSQCDAILVTTSTSVSMVCLPPRAERFRPPPCPEAGPGTISCAPASTLPPSPAGCGMCRLADCRAASRVSVAVPHDAHEQRTSYTR